MSDDIITLIVPRLTRRFSYIRRPRLPWKDVKQPRGAGLGDISCYVLYIFYCNKKYDTE